MDTAAADPERSGSTLRRERKRQDKTPSDEANIGKDKEHTSRSADAHIRRPPSAHDVQRGETEQRMSPESVPEVHIVGDIKCGVGFGAGVSCKWRFDHGKYWGLLEGSIDGHTQTAYGPEGAASVWDHPFDVHYQTMTMQGWPKIIVQIQQLDSYGCVSVIAHGFAHLPCTSGMHELAIPCWRAIGTQEEELRAYFLEEYPVLLDEDLVYHKAASHRHRLVTIPSGKVLLDVNIMLRHFREQRVDHTHQSLR